MRPAVSSHLKPSSAQAFYGTAEPVPFVESLPQPLKVSDGFMCWPNWPTEKSDLDKSVPMDPVERLDTIGKSKTCALRHRSSSTSIRDHCFKKLRQNSLDCTFQLPDRHSRNWVTSLRHHRIGGGIIGIDPSPLLIQASNNSKSRDACSKPADCPKFKKIVTGCRFCSPAYDV